MHCHPEEAATADVGARAAPILDATMREMKAETIGAPFNAPRFKKVEGAQRTWPAPLRRLLTNGPYAALTAGASALVGLAVGYFLGGQLQYHREAIEAQDRAERAELLGATQIMTGEIRTLQANIKTIAAARSQNVAALDSLRKRLDAAKTETSAAIAELTGKVEHLQRQTEARASLVSEQLNSIERTISERRPGQPGTAAAAVAGIQKEAKKQRGGVFNPTQNPGATGVPRPLRTPAD